LEYSIRLPQDTQSDTWFTDQLFIPKISKVARFEGDFPLRPPYFDSCFLTIQNDIERAFIAAVAGADKPLPATVLHRFPYPKVIEDVFAASFGTLFPLLFVFCLMLSSKNIIKVSTLFLKMFFLLVISFSHRTSPLSEKVSSRS
jgi:hypothetical protein